MSALNTLLGRVLLATGMLAAVLAAPSAPALAAEPPIRVAIVEASPPHSYLDAAGKPAGFMVDLAAALCESMQAACTFQVMHIDDVIDALSADKADFAAVTLLATPERRKKVLFSKPLFRSVSAWIAPPAVAPGTSTRPVAVVRGSAQASYVESQGWKATPVSTHLDIVPALASRQAEAALVPMLTAITLTSDQRIQSLGLKSTFLSDPLLSGDVCLSINPKHLPLRYRLDIAIDMIKSDGRFDRINTRHLPFRLQ